MKVRVPVTRIVTEYVEREIPDEWKKCCRCFPNAVGADGFCGCCRFNHVTGESDPWVDPDFDDAPVPEEGTADE
jgi:hypothetical protein